LLAGVPARAADLARPAAPAAPAAAPFAGPVFDAYLSAGGGYATSPFDPDLPGLGDETGGQGTLRGAATDPLAPRLGIQLDAAAGRGWNTLDDIDITLTDAVAAAHAFWRDATIGAVGVLGQYGSAQSRYEQGGHRATRDLDHAHVGVEGQYFLGSATLYGQAAYHDADGSYAGIGIDGDGIATAAQLRHFVTPDLMATLKGEYGRDTDDIRDISLDVDTSSVGLGGEVHLAALAGQPVRGRRLHQAQLRRVRRQDGHEGSADHGRRQTPLRHADADPARPCRRLVRPADTAAADRFRLLSRSPTPAPRPADGPGADLARTARPEPPKRRVPVTDRRPAPGPIPLPRPSGERRVGRAPAGARRMARCGGQRAARPASISATISPAAVCGSAAWAIGRATTT
jgi:hypothetical protein